ECDVGILPRDLARDPQEQSVGELHDVRLVHRGDLVALVRARVLEGELHDPARAELANVLDGDRRVLADLRVAFLLDDRAHARELGSPDVELDPGVEVLDVLADDHEVDVAHRRLDALVRLRRPEVRVQVELLAECDVHGAHARSELRRERSLETDLVPPQRVERGLRERVAEPLQRGDPDVVDVPFDLDTGCLDGTARRLDDLGARAITGDEGDAMRHCRWTFPYAMWKHSHRTLGRLA